MTGGIAPALASRARWIAEARATLRLGWPLILTNLAQTGMTATDVLMMGRLGPDAVAAGALGANLNFAFLIFGIGTMSGVAPLIASERGRRAHSVRDIRRTVQQGCWAALSLSIPFWAVLWHGDAILQAMGQDPALTVAAGGYLRMLMWSILPFLLYLVLRSFLAGLERPRWALVAVLVGLVFNAVGNWCLIFGHWGFPALGLPGSGLATSVATALMMLILVAVVALDRRFRRFHLLSGIWRWDWARFRRVWAIGLPIGATLAFEVTIFNAAVFIMGLLGAAQLAAHAIAIQIATLTFMVPLGVAQAATIRVGLAHGARDKEGIRLAGWIAFVMGVGFMVLMGLLMIAAPRMLIAAFIDPTDPANAAVVEYAIVFLSIAALFQVVDGAQAVGSGMLRGLHDTRAPMIYALLGYWGIGAPLGLVLAFPAGLGGVGLWSGLAGALAVVAALIVGRWLRRERLGLVSVSPPA